MANKAKIRESLIKQLENSGANVDHFHDLIDDYMCLYDVKKLLIKDIKTRGIVYKSLSASGIETEKNNPSVKDLVVVNKQMLSILKELDISTKNVTGDEDVL